MFEIEQRLERRAYYYACGCSKGRNLLQLVKQIFLLILIGPTDSFFGIRISPWELTITAGILYRPYKMAHTFFLV